ncbi:MAG: IS66 family transposase zinc-finger binding domain-containing protein, partial [Gemmataceae bacterium]
MLPEHLPDDPVVLKAWLRALQQAFEAQLKAQREAQAAQLATLVETLQREQEAALKAREAELQREFQQHLQAREAELQKAFNARILELYEQVRLSRRRMFGPRSEAHPGQGWLFDEAEALIEAAPEASDTAVLPPASAPSDDTSADPAKKKARGKRKPLSAALPRVDIVHELPEAERLCACGTPMVEIGQDVSEQLDIVPMQVRVLRHIKKRYACPKGDRAPISARAPAQVLPKSNASNDLLAMLLTTKYADGLPLAR